MNRTVQFTMREDIAERLLVAARRENMTVDELVEQLLDQNAPETKNKDADPGDGLRTMLAIIEADTTVELAGPSDASERVKEIMNTEFVEDYYARMKESAELFAAPAHQNDTDEPSSNG
jgi:hypothetical protein